MVCRLRWGDVPIVRSSRRRDRLLAAQNCKCAKPQLNGHVPQWLGVLFPGHNLSLGIYNCLSGYIWRASDG